MTIPKYVSSFAIGLFVGIGIGLLLAPMSLKRTARNVVDTDKALDEAPRPDGNTCRVAG